MNRSVSLIDPLPEGVFAPANVLECVLHDVKVESLGRKHTFVVHPEFAIGQITIIVQKPPVELISILFESQQADAERSVELVRISSAGFLSQSLVSSMGKRLVQGFVVLLCEDISELPVLKVDCDGGKFKLSGIPIKIHIHSANALSQRWL